MDKRSFKVKNTFTNNILNIESIPDSPLLKITNGDGCMQTCHSKTVVEQLKSGQLELFSEEENIVEKFSVYDEDSDNFYNVVLESGVYKLHCPYFTGIAYPKDNDPMNWINTVERLPYRMSYEDENYLYWNIPSEFKFTVPAYSELTYKAELYQHLNTYVITWINEDNDISSTTTYAAENVEKYVRQGDWKILS